MMGKAAKVYAPSNAAVVAAAVTASEAGISVCPPAEDGTKKPLPDLPTAISPADWKALQSIHADDATFGRWYGPRTGNGWVCGRVSDGLAVLDFDTVDAWDRFLARAGEWELADLVGWIADGYLERTPSGGHHLPFRLDECPGSTKLAMRPDPESGPRGRKTSVELKGEGGYVIVAPTYGDVHPSGAPYELLCGSVDTIRRITPDDFESLLALARSLDEMPPEPPVGQARSGGPGQADGLRPGDDFERRSTWAEILQPAGWKSVRTHGDQTDWRRPGKSAGISATTNHAGSGFLWVFSTSTVFEAGRSYTKFGAYALLHHGGDFAAATRALRAEGYGDARPRKATALNGHTVNGKNLDADDPPRSPPRFRILGSEAFHAKPYPVEWAIRRVIVKGQPCVVGAPRKGMKTNICVDLWASAASGLPFLGETTFSVPEPIPTLFLSGESGGGTIKETLQRVCDSKGIGDWATALRGRLFFDDSLPQLTNPDHVDELTTAIRVHGIGLVIIDPLYLCLTGTTNDGHRVDPANLYDTGPLLLSVSRACLDAGATPVIVHHFKQSGVETGQMPQLENLAFSGIQEFARQWILIGRRAHFDPATGRHALYLKTGGSVGFGGEWGLDIDEGILRDDFTGRIWDVKLAPLSAIAATKEAESIEQAALNQMRRARAAEEARAKQVEELAPKVVAAIKKIQRREKTVGTTKTKIRAETGFDSPKLGPVLAHLEDQGLIRAGIMHIPNGQAGRDVDGWILVEPTDDILPLHGAKNE